MKTSEIILIIVIGIFLFMSTQKTTVVQTPVIEQEQTPVVDTTQCNIDENIITFNNIDFYSPSTSIAEGIRILKTNNNQANIVISNEGTKSYTPGTTYTLLFGNRTTGLINGTDYYPEYVTGTFKCSGSETLTGKLPKIANVNYMSFSYWNSTEAINSAQALTTNEIQYVRLRFAVQDNACFGNPYAEKMGGKNVMCFQYNSSAIDSIQLVGSKEITQIPQTAKRISSYRTVSCYDFPVICDNADYYGKIVIDTSNSNEPTAGGGNISITLHDTTFDYDMDTLDLIVGIEDEPKTRNDIGVKDFGIQFNATALNPDDYLFSISIS